jgi:hypothetical protein
MRDALAVEDATADLRDLPLGMGDQGVEQRDALSQGLIISDCAGQLKRFLGQALPMSYL